MTFFKIKEILRGLTSSPILFSSYVCGIAQRFIRETMRSEQIKTVSFKDGILTLKVSGSVLATEIHLSEHKLIDQINAQLGMTIVRKIVVRQ